ncbi:KAT8 regulatory NSL complex subunit 3 [Halotydeus destructor]|nr:KAT8 regulatory NSL complex subunit 3 [Halotydeus destructor]
MTDCPPTPSTPGNDVNNQLMVYLHHLSGQKKEQNLLEIDHSYAKPWNRHPDPNIKSRSARFLFMKNFPRHFSKANYDRQMEVDVEDISDVNNEVNPLIYEVQTLVPRTPTTPTTPNISSGLNQEEAYMLHEKAPIDKRSWSPTMIKLWTKTVKVLEADRLGKLVSEGRPNEVIVRRNLLEKAASRLRQVFASVVLWDPNQLSWLHAALHQHLPGIYLVTYHEAMQLLRQKIPMLVDKFYNSQKQVRTNQLNRAKQLQADPIQTVLNNNRPKRINGSPLFLIVPNGPQIPHHFTSQRMKHWHNLFGSLGKVITVTVTQKSYSTATSCLTDIRLAVKDKIKECKATFNEGRPLVLVGFGASSVIASHCALDNAANVTATVCLGFPLTGLNGFRGDLDDPLLEITVPVLFVIGQNSTMCTLDDMEDFRERITKTETGLVVVGGCNDRLIVCGTKKRTEGITQGMVDRCIADEIYDFVTGVRQTSSDT